MTIKITIIDYGMGNLGSVLNMFKKIGVAAKVTSDLGEIGAAEALLLPGVGAFDSAMARINDSGLRTILDRKVLTEKTPLLGICLGMQLLTDSSEEGELPGLGYIPGETRRFRFDDPKLKIPHMGWNVIYPASPSVLTEDFIGEIRFYFVHSYYVKVADRRHAIMETEYGIRFDSGIQADHIFGVQFHPEKSHRFGMQMLKKFAEYCHAQN